MTIAKPTRPVPFEPEAQLAAFSAALQRLRPYLEPPHVDVASELLAQALATQLVQGLDLLGVTPGS
jgi:hypothetical protein